MLSLNDARSANYHTFTESLHDALEETKISYLLEKYLDYQDQVQRGRLGMMAQFWVSVIDHTHLLIMMQYAVKTNNFVLHHHCNRAIGDLFFA